ncbi:hypothetical protein Cob_v011536 [Colletotrichum orbiculare MAFF 240422]|uniref:Uncharacterized protein n=1 Tax=Colletotrichum orbiculare (strain 104-T / ATCC 96160 / CBS 514.97 / LARS 414 / MAFF 240422) TaxID=1213857 RepID=A0A484FBL5_COLOR|nr:hypothetical protein Cob_v011536 [Colletotrichum orbiculare MAFF 240422]
MRASPTRCREHLSSEGPLQTRNSGEGKRKAGLEERDKERVSGERNIRRKPTVPGRFPMNPLLPRSSSPPLGLAASIFEPRKAVSRRERSERG